MINSCRIKEVRQLREVDMFALVNDSNWVIIKYQLRNPHRK